LQDADGDVGGGSAAVAFEVELALEGLVDGFDVLPDGGEQRPAEAWWFGAVGGPDHVDVAFVEPGFGGVVAVALVHDQDESVGVMEHVGL
jgi:hypothetical protein